GIVRQPAGRADAGAVGGMIVSLLAAAPAILVRAVPVDNLHRPAREPELVLVQHAEQRTQPLKTPARWRLDFGSHFGGVTGPVVQPAQELLPFGDKPQLAQSVPSGQEVVCLPVGDQQTVALEDKPTGGRALADAF